MKKFLLAIVVVAEMVFAANADDYVFAKYVPITIAYSGKEVSNFPMLLKVDGTKIPDFYSDVKNAGADLKFTDTTGAVEYPYEVDTWNDDGSSLVWVKLPSFADKISFRMYYGCAEKSVNESAADVWTGYHGVWHLDSNLKDSSAHGYDCVAANTVGATTGIVGSGHQIAASDTVSPNAGALYADGSESAALSEGFTYSAWIKHHTTTTAQELLFATTEKTWGAKNGISIRASGWGGKELYVVGDNAKARTDSTGIDWADGNWHLFSMSVQGLECKLYVDGILGATVTFQGSHLVKDTGLPFVFGNHSNADDANIGTADSEGLSWKGLFDELRVNSIIESADWQKAAYAVVAQDVCSFGEPVECTGLEVVFTSDVSSGGAPLDVEFSAEVKQATGVVTYRWDFDNDGAFDLETDRAEVSHRYETKGRKSVRLVVVDETEASAELVIENMITVNHTTATTLYVDFGGDTGGDGSEAKPYESLAPLAYDLIAGDTVCVRGVYTIASSADAISIPDGVTIKSWGEAHPTIEIDADYGATGVFDIFTVNGDGVRIEDVDFVVHDSSFNAETCLIRISGKNFMLSGCSITIVEQSIGAYASKGIATLVACANAEATGVNVRGCRFSNLRLVNMDAFTLAANATLVGNVFEDCASIVCGVENTHCNDFLFASNRVHFATGKASAWADGPTSAQGSVFRSGENGLGRAEVAYNVFTDTQGLRGVFFESMNGTGAFTDAIDFHHNTVDGFKVIAGTGQTFTACPMHFFDNVICATSLVIDMFNQCSRFQAYFFDSFGTFGKTASGAFFRNNAYYLTGELAMGDAVDYDGDNKYDIVRDLDIQDNNIVLDAAPTFISTDPTSPDYYRTKQKMNPTWAVKDKAWTDGDKYPDFIGAVQPVFSGGFILLLR